MKRGLEIWSSHSMWQAIVVRCLFMLLLILCAATETQAAVITVSTGSDSLANGDQFQNALNLAACGDTIVLQAGATYATRVGWVNQYGPIGSPFSLPNKSCATGQYVTIQTSQIGSLPSGRISPSNIGLMATLATNTSYSVIEPASGAGNYQFIGIEFTNTASLTTNNGNTTFIVLATPQSPTSGKWGHDMVFDRVWIHPYEDVTNPSSPTRSASIAINLDGANQTIKNSYISGFCCFTGNAPTTPQTSVGISVNSGPGPLTITNNFVEAYGWNIFTGGGGASDPGSILIDPANTATISGATTTQATFSQTATLRVGDYVAFVVPQWTTLVNCGGGKGGGGTPSRGYVVVVDSITPATGLVTYHGAGCDSIADGPSLPADGTRAQWRGRHLDGVTVRGNTFSKRTEWCSGTYGIAKAVWEMKDGSHVLFEGNIVNVPALYAGNPIGCSPLTTAMGLNQDGTAPWMASNQNVFRNNIFRGVREIMHLQNYAMNTSAAPECGFTFSNNLLDGSAKSAWMTTSGGCNLTFTHNTARGMTNSMFFDASNGSWPSVNIVVRDNIATSGRYFFNEPGGAGTGYPGKTEHHNVIINNSGVAPPSYMSNDFVVPNDAAVGFVNVTSADAGGDYHGYALASTSAFKGRASDGTDPGVNFELLDAALALGSSGSGGSSGGSGGTSGGGSVLSAPSNLTVR